jgi:mannose-6-phosphate isomerase-like protein (cupin superfamily)
VGQLPHAHDGRLFVRSSGRNVDHEAFDEAVLGPRAHPDRGAFDTAFEALTQVARLPPWNAAIEAPVDDPGRSASPRPTRSTHHRPDPTTQQPRRTTMAKLSKHTADKVIDVPQAEDRSSDLDEYTVSFVTIKETHDLAPALAALPGGRCSCPHWGYVISGRIVVTYADHDETIGAGEAFYMPPGHTPMSDAGTEFVMFSPVEDLRATNEAIMAAMAPTASD